jgi:phosphoserine phosphatase
VLTTATNRFITELTAQAPGHRAPDRHRLRLGADGRFTGAVTGTLNMRDGKVTRLRDWLAAQGAPWAHDSVLYSDSINDLPLLQAVGRAVAVDPDPRLAAEAVARGWTVLRWRDPVAPGSTPAARVDQPAAS